MGELLFAACFFVIHLGETLETSGVILPGIIFLSFPFFNQVAPSPCKPAGYFGVLL